MESDSSPSPSSPLRWAMIVGAMIGLGGGLMLCAIVHAQSLWPTPEIHGTVRDLTHLPQLPFFPMQPDNLQHQLWSQPGVGVIQKPTYFQSAPTMDDREITRCVRVGDMTNTPYQPTYCDRVWSMSAAPYPKGTHELFQKIIDDFERHKIQ